MQPNTMMAIGVTGHQRISDPTAWEWVRQEIAKQLPAAAPFTGISSLAKGADQLFAECVLEAGGLLTAVIPFPDYERTFQGEDKQKYLHLLFQSTNVRVLRAQPDDEQAFLDAGILVVDLCEVLLAVWDGKPAKGKGGTGDAVQYALQRGRSVVHLNPDSRTIQVLNRDDKNPLPSTP